MPRYQYVCANCVRKWEEDRSVDYRNAPCVLPCPHCGEYYVNRVASAPSFKVSEGVCGNSANGYSSVRKGE